MRDQQRMLRALRKENHLARAVRRHRGHQRVSSIQHGMAIRCDVLHDDLLDAGDILRRMHVALAEVITLADIGYHGHRALVETQSLA